ncbi:MAG TPA: DUF6062 family protein [Candidatus Methylomirabilis sp.]|nr:DUF6062 family protein [Candidatus Methylomirabilis sp.]
MMDRGRQEPSKFISYFELKDAFREEGCPICRLLLKWTRRSLNSLSHEYVNDPGVRQQLRASHGFCNWHAWMAATIDNSQSGIAIIYEHLLRDQIGRLRDFRARIGPRSWWARLKTKWPRGEDPSRILAQRQQKAPCAACERMDVFFERNLIDTLVAHITDREFVDGFRLSFGLCLPHLYQAVATGRDHPNLPILIDVQLEKLGTLRGELNEYIRKLDYRYMAEPRGEEKTAWRRVIELFVGKQEVFGPDRRPRDEAPDPVQTPPHAVGPKAGTEWWLRDSNAAVNTPE